MAKKKPDQATLDKFDAAEQAPADDSIEPAAEVVDPDELHALRARVAELKAENARLKGDAPPVGPADDGPKRKWKGSIKHGVPIIVAAESELHAQQAYKEAAGIITSDHQIEVHEVGEDAVLGVVPFHER